VSKPTPGPWRVETEFGVKKFNESTGEPLRPLNYHYVKGAEGRSLLLIASTHASDPDARLIAAAPELKIACEGALAALLLYPHVDKLRAIDYLREILAKVEGPK
jgi:hypothetical protein